MSRDLFLLLKGHVLMTVAHESAAFVLFILKRGFRGYVCVCMGDPCRCRRHNGWIVDMSSLLGIKLRGLLFAPHSSVSMFA